MLRQWLSPRISPLPPECNSIPSAIDRLKFFERCEYFQRVNHIEGVYCEFGCHSAQTFRMALNTVGQLRKRASFTSHFYAFDTFEGMPEPVGKDRQKRWRKHANATSMERFSQLIKPDLYRTTMVPGLFSQTLNRFKLGENERISLAYIDCDYYASTIEALAFCQEYFFHGSVVAFDDWNCYYFDPKRGQQLALAEWREKVKDKFTLVEFVKIGGSGQSFVVLSNELIGSEVL